MTTGLDRFIVRLRAALEDPIGQTPSRQDVLQNIFESAQTLSAAVHENLTIRQQLLVTLAEIQNDLAELLDRSGKPHVRAPVPLSRAEQLLHEGHELLRKGADAATLLDAATANYALYHVSLVVTGIPPEARAAAVYGRFQRQLLWWRIRLWLREIIAQVPVWRKPRIPRVIRLVKAMAGVATMADVAFLLGDSLVELLDDTSNSEASIRALIVAGLQMNAVLGAIERENEVWRWAFKGITSVHSVKAPPPDFKFEPQQ